MSVRVRFAPSPTGPLHIGGVRTALYNFLFAKKNHGEFILRIEDTDKKRFVDGAEDYIHDALEWMGINPSEGPLQGGAYGPYRQGDRKSLYVKHIERLFAERKVYMAFDSNEELTALRKEAEQKGDTFSYNWKNRSQLRNSIALSAEEVRVLLEKNTPFVYRFLTYSEGDAKQLRFQDEIRGDLTIDASLLDDKVLVKQDGMPTYHLANVIDDHLMEISHVIRGEEWLPSLALHVMLYKAFGWKPPVFAHVPLILKPSGKGKLSKRDGEAFGFPVFPLRWDATTEGFRESGYLPEALLNYLALLGWNDGGEKEIFSIDELISVFSLDGITKSGGRFDPDRCAWFNQHYLSELPSALLVPLLENELRERNIRASHVGLTEVASLIQPRLTLLSDIWGEAALFFEDPKEFEEKAISKQWKSETPDILLGVAEVLKDASFESAEAISQEIKRWATDKNIRLGAVMAPLRLALVGAMKGPDVFAICYLIGVDACVRRIDRAAALIST